MEKARRRDCKDPQTFSGKWPQIMESAPRGMLWLLACLHVPRTTVRVTNPPARTQLSRWYPPAPAQVWDACGTQMLEVPGGNLPVPPSWLPGAISTPRRKGPRSNLANVLGGSKTLGTWGSATGPSTALPGQLATAWEAAGCWSGVVTGYRPQLPPTVVPIWALSHDPGPFLYRRWHLLECSGSS